VSAIVALSGTCVAITQAGNQCRREGDFVGPVLLCWKHKQEFITAQDRQRARDASQAADRRREKCRVYYVERTAEGLIKIGFTQNLRSRLASLRREWGDLRLLATHQGDATVEGHVHAQFADLRVLGEWFTPDDRLRRHIVRLQHRPYNDQGSFPSSTARRDAVMTRARFRTVSTLQGNSLVLTNS
jgi:hypothetical protein